MRISSLKYSAPRIVKGRSIMRVPTRNMAAAGQPQAPHSASKDEVRTPADMSSYTTVIVGAAAALGIIYWMGFFESADKKAGKPASLTIDQPTVNQSGATQHPSTSTVGSSPKQQHLSK